MSRLILDRRHFLALAGASWVAGLSPRGADAAMTGDALFVTAFQDGDDAFGLALVNSDGALVSREALPARGHGFATGGPDGRAVVFARRPGRFALAFQPGSTAEPILFESPEDRHFYGHGVFSADRHLLYATENAYESGEGRIGVYDATNRFRRLGEMPSGGIDPHDLMLVEGGKTLVIANGGILTHPDTGRQKLNLDSMESRITRLDVTHGEITASASLPKDLHRLSLRHMAQGASGDIFIGGQYEGNAADRPPLLARLSADGALSMIDLPEAVLTRLSNYIGSVAASTDGGRIAITSPEGGTMLVLDARTGAVTEEITQPRVCGVAATETTFLTSNENGKLGPRQHALHWDNHMKRIG